MPDNASTPRTSWASLVVILAVVWGGSQGGAWWKEQNTARQLRSQARQDSIVLYTTSDCPYCARARAWLNAHHIPWRECNVDLDAACKRIYEGQGAPGVPLVHANQQWRLGFDPAWISEALR